MVPDGRAIDSILALDCGSVFTRVDLFGLVDGKSRFVGQGEVHSPVGVPGVSLANSVRQAAGQLSGAVGLRLLDEQGGIICPKHQREGVDAVVATVSATEPLRVVLAGITHDVSLASAQRALSGTCSRVEGVVSRDGRGRAIRVDNVEGHVRLVQELGPDVIVVVGGVDGGPVEPVLQMVEAMAVACSMHQARSRNSIVYAGNAALWSRVSEIVNGKADLTIVDNVRPSMSVANLAPLQQEIDAQYRQRKIGRLPGSRSLASWSSGLVLPATRSYAHALEYVSRAEGIDILGVDIGGATTTLASVIDEHLSLTVRTDLGLDGNIARILDLVPLSSVLRWLPFDVEPAAVRNALEYKGSHPRTLPKTNQDFSLEQAVAREILRQAVLGADLHGSTGGSSGRAARLPGYDLILGGGAVLSRAPSHAQAALVLIDALQPVGVTGLALDQASLLAPAGAVAMANPLAAAQILEQDGLLSLGTVVAPLGTGRVGETMLACRVEFGSGRVLETEVPYGSLQVIPLAPLQSANLELRPTRHFDVGLGIKGQAGFTMVAGGAVGIILDARGRPLPLDEDPGVQRENVRRWLRAMTC